MLLRPLAIEHVEPVVDGDSDSIGDGTTISISASASNISLGWLKMSREKAVERGVSMNCGGGPECNLILTRAKLERDGPRGGLENR